MNSTENSFKIDPHLCPENLIAGEQETHQNQVLQENPHDYKTSTDSSVENQTEAIDDIIEPARLVSQASNENYSLSFMTTDLSTRDSYYDQNPPVTTSRVPIIFRTTQSFNNSYPVKRFHPSSTMPNNWRLRNSYPDMQHSQSSPYRSTDYNSSPGPTSMILMRDKWRNKSGCYYSCIQQAKGLQTVVSKYDFATNIQLCEPTKIVS